VPKLLTDFKKFLLRGNVVDLAVAVVIGTVFTAVVKALVTDLITPLVAAMFGKPSFESLSFTINGSQLAMADWGPRCARRPWEIRLRALRGHKRACAGFP
jgi:large conductance mechanosensitive channel protein